MKSTTAVLVLLVAVAYVSARALEGGFKDTNKGLIPRCNKNHVGEKNPFRLNPRKYWYCTEFGLLLAKCPKGTWFVDAEKACVTDEEPGCEPEQPEEPIEEETETPVESEEEPIEEETEGPVDSEEPIEEETEAPADSEEPIEEETEAPADSEEPIEEETEAPADSEEPVEEETEAPADSEEPIEEETEAPADSEEPEDSEEPIEEETQAPTDAPTQAPTDAPTQAPTEPPQTCEVACSYHGEYIANPTDCNSFYQCSWGVPYLHQCPLMNQETGERLVFNPTIDVCDWPSAYHCEAAPGCQEPEPVPECPPVQCEYLGQYLPNPADCHSFYQCAWDRDHSLRAVLHQCAMEDAQNRLVFNTELNVCDWSTNVECRQSC